MLLDMLDYEVEDRYFFTIRAVDRDGMSDGRARCVVCVCTYLLLMPLAIDGVSLQVIQWSTLITNSSITNFLI